MNADTLAQQFPWTAVRGSLDREITGCASDSRHVDPGDLFLCFVGERSDGHTFVSEALARGAAGIVAQREIELPDGVPFYLCPDVRLMAGHLASSIYGNPSSHLKLIGVTGTSGKTTTTYFLREALAACGKQVQLLGSLNPTSEFPSFTTPEAPALQKRLGQFVRQGTEYVVLEVSSHAIHFDRVNGSTFTAAVLTNLYRDHLELHGTEEEYARTKLSFLLSLQGKGPVALNKDFPRSAEFVEACRGFAHTYSLLGPADVRGYVQAAGPEISELSIRAGDSSWPARIHLPGQVNCANAVAAFTILYVLGLDPLALVEGLSKLETMNGRYWQRQAPWGARIMVDYAHTPVALDRILDFARSQAQQVILVFGAVGAGDRGKRPQMGGLAAEKADRVFLTTDDPRGEDPQIILAEVEAGLIEKGRHRGIEYEVIADRREAIKAALAESRQGDWVVIAGRGHERVQRFGEDTWVMLNDAEEVEAYLQRWK
ncbi:MAG: UDP-N-acetylmuramoyl-L-alanyl-D-glutamate--2,6-diaminopimelate ligase [Coprothermobacterota bacterium]|nr:UDP-N-acetylmuramoyl-L-alanyl-D-glutamate--2,6-diaminopimelate ligase [Coprothermobacterota bacterium]